ncbi:MAG: hypothetical protein E7257_08420 [Lachnospiraceae bacterium]|nr:hypothetical protein [Lachnospiraceae bacterium]
MIDKSKLILPVYLNENIVMDMLAIIEDGFSMVSEISTSSVATTNKNEKVNATFATSDLLSKLLKIELGAESNKKSEDENSTNSKTEKIHTSTSLLSKFRSELLELGLMTSTSDTGVNINEIEAGDFIEVTGELMKNPMVNILEKAIDVFRMADIFSDKPELGSKKQTSTKNTQDAKIVKQMKMFLDELKVTGTIDFVMKNCNSTIVLSAQEQYLQNDNISELLGGKFKVLGKVIKVCKQSGDSINLLRKTTLDVLKDEELKTFTEIFENAELKKFNLPDVEVKIEAPAAIVIPIAIYV